jgi:hypothetical protein
MDQTSSVFITFLRQLWIPFCDLANTNICTSIQRMSYKENNSGGTMQHSTTKQNKKQKMREERKVREKSKSSVKFQYCYKEHSFTLES